MKNKQTFLEILDSMDGLETAPPKIPKTTLKERMSKMKKEKPETESEEEFSNKRDFKEETRKAVKSIKSYERRQTADTLKTKKGKNTSIEESTSADYIKSYFDFYIRTLGIIDCLLEKQEKQIIMEKLHQKNAFSEKQAKIRLEKLREKVVSDYEENTKDIELDESLKNAAKTFPIHSLFEDIYLNNENIENRENIVNFVIAYNEGYANGFMFTIEEIEIEYLQGIKELTKEREKNQERLRKIGQ